MAGFFGLFDYTKPGKGVDVNAPPKKAFFRFWELYWRKFSRFIVLNIIAFLFLLPILAFISQAFASWYYGLLSEEVWEAVLQGSEEEAVIVFGVLQSLLLSFSVSAPPQLALFLLAVSAVFYGPVMCGMTYVLRNFWREEHAWVSDFFVQMKKNFGQGVALGLLEIAAVTTLLFNITTQPTEETASWLVFSLPIIKYISIFLLALVLFARQYTYAMAVTFNLRISVIIKNAFAFSIVGLFRNAGVILLEAVLIFSVFFLPVSFYDLVFVPFFFFSFTGFLTIFATFPLINKHMLLPALKRQEESASEEPEEPG